MMYKGIYADGVSGIKGEAMNKGAAASGIKAGEPPTGCTTSPLSA